MRGRKRFPQEKNRETSDTAGTHQDAKLHESSWHNQEVMMAYANTVDYISMTIVIIGLL